MMKQVQSTGIRRGMALGNILVAAAIALSACGGTTVETEADESIAPLSREPASSSSSSSSASSSSSESSSASSGESSGAASSSSAPAATSEPAGLDQPAQEITAVPQQQLSDTDVRYLQGLQNAGIDTAGIQPEMVSAGIMVCEGSDDDLTQATVRAIAGQVVQQQRSAAQEDAVMDTITKEAQQAYCP